MISVAEKAWRGTVGAAYTDRSMLSTTQLNELYKRCYGVTRSRLNRLFLEGLPRDMAILEAGCNVGMQLRHLKGLGFHNLQGIELQQYAIDRLCVYDVPIQQGSVTALPYDDQDFDMVFTSGLLIHLALADLKKAMREIHRCTRRYIWGFEYYSRDLVFSDARGWKGLLWSGDYPGMYLNCFPDLRPVLQKWMPDRDPARAGVVGHMYLLERVQ